MNIYHVQINHGGYADSFVVKADSDEEAVMLIGETQLITVAPAYGGIVTQEVGINGEGVLSIIKGYY